MNSRFLPGHEREAKPNLENVRKLVPANLDESTEKAVRESIPTNWIYNEKATATLWQDLEAQTREIPDTRDEEESAFKKIDESANKIRSAIQEFELNDQELLVELMNLIGEENAESFDQNELLMEAKLRLGSMIEEHVDFSERQNKLLESILFWFQQTKQNQSELNSEMQTPPEIAGQGLQQLKDTLQDLIESKEARGERATLLHQDIVHNLSQKVNEYQKEVAQKDILITQIQQELNDSKRIRGRRTSVKSSIDMDGELAKSQRRVLELNSQVARLKSALEEISKNSQPIEEAREVLNKLSAQGDESAKSSQVFSVERELEFEARLKALADEVTSLKAENKNFREAQMKIKQNEMKLEKKAASMERQKLSAEQSLETAKKKYEILEKTMEQKIEEAKQEFIQSKGGNTLDPTFELARQYEAKIAKIHEDNRAALKSVQDAADARYKRQLTDMMKTIEAGDQKSAFEGTVNRLMEEMETAKVNADKEVRKMRETFSKKISDMTRHYEKIIEQKGFENESIRLSVDSQVKNKLLDLKLEFEEQTNQKVLEAQSKMTEDVTELKNSLLKQIDELKVKLSDVTRERDSLKTVVIAADLGVDLEEDEEEEQKEADDVLSKSLAALQERELEQKISEKYNIIMNTHKKIMDESREWEIEQAKNYYKNLYDGKLNDFRKDIAAKIQAIYEASPHDDETVDQLLLGVLEEVNNHGSESPRSSRSATVPLLEVDKKMTELQTRLADALSELEILKVTYKHITPDGKIDTSAVDELQGIVKDKTGQIKQLSADNAKLQREVKSLSTQVSQLNSQIQSRADSQAVTRPTSGQISEYPSFTFQLSIGTPLTNEFMAINPMLSESTPRYVDQMSAPQSQQVSSNPTPRSTKSISHSNSNSISDSNSNSKSNSNNSNSNSNSNQEQISDIKIPEIDTSEVLSKAHTPRKSSRPKYLNVSWIVAFDIDDPTSEGAVNQSCTPSPIEIEKSVVQIPSNNPEDDGLPLHCQCPSCQKVIGFQPEAVEHKFTMCGRINCPSCSNRIVVPSVVTDEDEFVPVQPPKKQPPNKLMPTQHSVEFFKTNEETSNVGIQVSNTPTNEDHNKVLESNADLKTRLMAAESKARQMADKVQDIEAASAVKLAEVEAYYKERISMLETTLGKVEAAIAAAEEEEDYSDNPQVEIITQTEEHKPDIAISSPVTTDQPAEDDSPFVTPVSSGRVGSERPSSIIIKEHSQIPAQSEPVSAHRSPERAIRKKISSKNVLNLIGSAKDVISRIKTETNPQPEKKIQHPIKIIERIPDFVSTGVPGLVIELAGLKGQYEALMKKMNEYWWNSRILVKRSMKTFRSAIDEKDNEIEKLQKTIDDKESIIKEKIAQLELLTGRVETLRTENEKLQETISKATTQYQQILLDQNGRNDIVEVMRTTEADQELQINKLTDDVIHNKIEARDANAEAETLKVENVKLQDALEFRQSSTSSLPSVSSVKSNTKMAMVPSFQLFGINQTLKDFYSSQESQEGSNKEPKVSGFALMSRNEAKELSINGTVTKQMEMVNKPTEKKPPKPLIILQKPQKPSMPPILKTPVSGTIKTPKQHSRMQKAPIPRPEEPKPLPPKPLKFEKLVPVDTGDDSKSVVAYITRYVKEEELQVPTSRKTQRTARKEIQNGPLKIESIPVDIPPTTPVSERTEVAPHSAQTTRSTDWKGTVTVDNLKVGDGNESVINAYQRRIRQLETMLNERSQKMQQGLDKAHEQGILLFKAKQEIAKSLRAKKKAELLSEASKKSLARAMELVVERDRKIVALKKMISEFQAIADAIRARKIAEEHSKARGIHSTQAPEEKTQRDRMLHILNESRAFANMAMNEMRSLERWQVKRNDFVQKEQNRMLKVLEAAQLLNKKGPSLPDIKVTGRPSTAKASSTQISSTSESAKRSQTNTAVTTTVIK